MYDGSQDRNNWDILNHLQSPGKSSDLLLLLLLAFPFEELVPLALASSLNAKSWWPSKLSDDLLDSCCSHFTFCTLEFLLDIIRRFDPEHEGFEFFELELFRLGRTALTIFNFRAERFPDTFFISISFRGSLLYRSDTADATVVLNL